LLTHFVANSVPAAVQWGKKFSLHILLGLIIPAQEWAVLKSYPLFASHALTLPAFFFYIFVR
jgi:hypothetical protein